MADSCAGVRHVQHENANLASWSQVPGADLVKHGQPIEARSGCPIVKTAQRTIRSISLPSATHGQDITQPDGLSLSCQRVPSARVVVKTLSKTEKEPVQPDAPEGVLKTIANSTSPASHLKSHFDFSTLSGSHSKTSFDYIAPAGLVHPCYSIQRRVSHPTDTRTAQGWVARPSYFDGSNLSSVLTCGKLDPRLDETADKAFDMQEANRAVLTKILEIISQLKAVHENDMSELKSDFESKLCTAEKNLMESMTVQHNILQTNVDSRLCALEEAKQEFAQVKENRICGSEEDTYVPPKEREVIRQLSSDQKEEVANLKAHVENRLRNLEDHFAHMSKEFQETIFKNQCRQQEEDSTGWETILEDRVAVFRHKGIQQQEFEKTRVTKSKCTLQQRLCEAEGNISLIVSILTNMQHQQHISSKEQPANPLSQSTSPGLLEHNISIIPSEQHPSSPFAPFRPAAEPPVTADHHAALQTMPALSGSSEELSHVDDKTCFERTSQHDQAPLLHVDRTCYPILE